MSKPVTGIDVCPCRAGDKPALLYSACCKPFHSGEKLPLTAEQLMRSRYSAFASSEVDYLIQTHYPVDNSDTNKQALSASCQNTQWLKLDVLNTKQGGETDSTGVVEFVASCFQNGQIGQMRETSSFRKIDGRWYYIEGTVFEE